MSNKAMVQFDEFPLPQSSLRQLPDDHIAALGIMGYAVTELNILARIYLAQTAEEIGQRAIDEIIKAQKLFVLRAWSSKLFEVKEFLASLAGKKSPTSDSVLRRLASEALQSLDSLSSTEGYRAANDIRHEAAHHYSFVAAKKNLAHLPSDALCDIILHNSRGNDFFPLGEYLMFHSRLQRLWKSEPSLEEKKRKFEVWLRWCLEAKHSIEESNAKFVSELLFSKLGRSTLHRKTYWVPEGLVGHPFDHRTPVIFREDRNP